MKSELLLGWLGVSLGWLFDTYEISLNSIIIVAISKELNFTSIQSAVIAGLILLSIAIGGILFGVVGDKIGRRNTLYITIGTYAFGTLMRALTFNYFWLITWTIITGIGLGGEYGVGQALITEISPKERRGWWSGTFYSFFGVGTIIASLVGIFLIPTIGWRLTFVFSFLISLIPLILRKWTPESSLWKSRKREERGVLLNNTIYNPSFLKVFFKCLVAGIIQFFGYYLINLALPLYLTSIGLSLTSASYFILIIGAGVWFGGVLGAYITDRIGRIRTGISGMIIASISSILLFLTASFIRNELLYILFFTEAAGFSISAQNLGVLFSEQFPTVVRSTGTSSALQIARGFSFFPPIIATLMYTSYGYSLVFLTGSILTITLALYYNAFKETRGINADF